GVAASTARPDATGATAGVATSARIDRLPVVIAIAARSAQSRRSEQNIRCVGNAAPFLCLPRHFFVLADAALPWKLPIIPTQCAIVARGQQPFQMTPRQSRPVRSVDRAI